MSPSTREKETSASASKNPLNLEMVADTTVTASVKAEKPSSILEACGTNNAQKDIEYKFSWRYAWIFLFALTLTKPLSGLPFYVGSILVTLAAMLQLILPLRRMDAHRLGYSSLGLSLHKWRDDLKNVGWLIAVTFPPYIVGYHFFATELRDWIIATDINLFQNMLRYIPKGHFHLPKMDGTWAYLLLGYWFLKTCLTHYLGVAIPEETFYRGYLQPLFAHRWPPRVKIVGAFMGKATLVSCGLFALGHVLGEWNPLRLAPFFPGLLFAWLRNRSGTVLGAILYHGSCNVLGQLLALFYFGVRG